MPYLISLLLAAAGFVLAYLLGPMVVEKLAKVTVKVPDVMSINVLGLVLGILLSVLVFRYSQPWLKKSMKPSA